MRRAGVDGRIDNVLSASDAAKALYTLKMERQLRGQTGGVQYSECGQFSFVYVAPFFCAAVLFAVLWEVQSSSY